MTAAETDSTAGGSVITLPKGGGAVSGLGETFSPDLFTGTGTFSVPITLPAGRGGAQPQLTLGYSTGNGNGPFGVGWQLSLPGVARRTSRGIPRYRDSGPTAETDVFVLSGAEDLVPVGSPAPGRRRYRPRTEGLFARIEHVDDATGNYWLVLSTGGESTRYGTPRPSGAAPDWVDPATTHDPDDPRRIFGWRVTRSTDTFGNQVRYDYRRDQGSEPGHRWDVPLLSRISYADYGDPADPRFLVTVDFDYEPRPDRTSERRAAFEVRTTQRCRRIRIGTHAADGVSRPLREVRLGYEQAPFNGASLLVRVESVGVDDRNGTRPADPLLEPLPPLRFGYSGFTPERRRFEPLTGPALPTKPLSDPELALVDLHGHGLPDIVELGATRRFWANRGGGRFDLPRAIDQAPPVTLADPGVTFLDARATGRADLLVISAASAGFFPLTFSSTWATSGFRAYRQLPTVALDDPRVRLVDLDGDGLTDVLHSGTRLECFFNDPDPALAWRRTAAVEPPWRADGLDLDLADRRVHLADMTGDGLQDLVFVRNGNVVYWPNLGHGRWGAMVSMRRSPRLPVDFVPERVLLGDLDGDGLADLAYVDRGRVLLWGNHSGTTWSEEPVTIAGTPTLSTVDDVRLSDLHGTGMAGLLWSLTTGSGMSLRFLSPTGGTKPYLLTTVDNSRGARTTIEYRSSTDFAAADRADPAARWRTTLPFPVHVVASVRVDDQISGGRLTSRYRYRHGYWDGLEREFRGFATVDQLDADEPGDTAGAAPPTLSRSFFHLGPVEDQTGRSAELDLTGDFWSGDGPLLSRTPQVEAFLAGLEPLARRAALRTFRGSVLRTELFALDGGDRQERPFTVTEAVYGIREEAPVDGSEPGRPRIFLPFPLGQRTTEWERGEEAMTRFTFTGEPDGYGFPTAQVAVAVPRGRNPLRPAGQDAEPYLATYTTTEYARRDDPERYLVDRVCRTTTHEVVNDGRAPAAALRDAVLRGAGTLRVVGHTRTHYDGPAFTGLPVGELGEHGAPVRTESLAFTDAFLAELGGAPPYLDPTGATSWTPEYPAGFRTGTPPLAGYRHYAESEVPGSPGGYYVQAERHRYDVHDPGRRPRGLLVSTMDPHGAVRDIDFDGHDLLAVRTVDQAGLAIEGGYDLRVLQPARVTDANGNVSEVEFSPAGLVTAQYLRAADGQGDRAEPHLRTEYDLHAFAERGQPASVRTTRRVHHDTETDVPPAERDAVLVSVEYSDGFGRQLQTRAIAEDVLFGDAAFGGGVLAADQMAPDADVVGRARRPGDPDNVVVSGWQVYDTKGRVVRRYEPFYAAGWEYAAPGEAQLGRSSTTAYDPRGNAVQTVNPDGSRLRVVHGAPVDLADPEQYRPTPWETYTYDANDNAGRTHEAAAEAYRRHWNTPASIVVDALGRTVVAVARNGEDPDRHWEVTRSRYDIQDNLLAVTDPLGRPAFSYRFDLTKRRWRVDSIDGGRRDSVPDSSGVPVETRDAKGSLTLTSFDPLHRPSRVWARSGTGSAVTLRQRIEYGDGGTAGQPAAERAAARARNLLGRPARHHDEAGLVTVVAVDARGNVLESVRRVIADAPVLAVYERAAADGWRVEPFQVDWRTGAGRSLADREAELLDPREYLTTTAYDALQRVVRRVLPPDVAGRRHVLRPTYNRAGNLEQLRLDDTVHLRRIGYDAKGLRTLAVYGNGTLVRFAYDPETFRLVRTRAEDHTLVGTDTYRPGGTVLQDQGFDYDLVGNVLAVRHRTPASGVRANGAAFASADPRVGRLLVAGDALDREFAYDPQYRLVRATGRELDAPGRDPWVDSPRGEDPTLTRPYTETYDYDRAGNLRRLSRPGGPTRTYTLVPGTNRLRQMEVAGTPYAYAFDENGNLTGETSSRHFSWDQSDRLVAFATQVAGAEPSVHVQHLHDSAGRRVKTVVRRQGGQLDVIDFPDPNLEHQRWSGNGAAGANVLVNVLDDERRVGTVRIGPSHPAERGPDVTVHVTDHLGSNSVALDQAGALVSREEFTPYGETSFGSYARKRYRFVGQERDELSGLARHGARQYAPWLGRWASCDPAGLDAGPNLFSYCGQNPTSRRDTTGHDWEWCNPISDDECGFASSVEVLDTEIKVDDAAAGFGDTVSFGLTARVRRWFSADDTVDYESAQYKGGQVAGVAHGMVLGGGGLFASARAIGVRATAKTAATTILATEGAARVADKIEPSGTASSILRFGVAWGSLAGLGRSKPPAPTPGPPPPPPPPAPAPPAAPAPVQAPAPPPAAPAPAGPQVGPYRNVGGHHIHQSAAYSPAGTASRAGNPNHRAAVSIQQNVPGFTEADHARASLLQLNVNRAQWGETVNAPQIGAVSISVSGNGTATGQASQHFEDVKAFFGLLAAGVPSNAALGIVGASRTQMGANPQPVRVPRS